MTIWFQQWLATLEFCPFKRRFFPEAINLWIIQLAFCCVAFLQNLPRLVLLHSDKLILNLYIHYSTIVNWRIDLSICVWSIAQQKKFGTNYFEILPILFQFQLFLISALFVIWWKNETFFICLVWPNWMTAVCPPACGLCPASAAAVVASSAAAVGQKTRKQN